MFTRTHSLARNTTPAAALALSVLLLAGCGSSAPSKSEYTAKANAVCASTNAKTGPAIQQVTAAASALEKGGASGLPRLADAIAQLHAAAASGLAQLEKLEQPSGDHTQISAFLVSYSTVVSGINEAATLLAKGQPQQAVATLERLKPAAEQAAHGAQAYGLTQCATGFSTLA